MHDVKWTEIKDLPTEVAPWLEELYGGEVGKITELLNSEQNGERNEGDREEKMH
jgi:hypothetical protein